MNDLLFATFNASDPYMLSALIIALVGVVLLDTLIFLVLRKWVLAIIIAFLQAIVFISYYCNLEILFFLSLAFSVIYGIGVVFANLAEFRWYFSPNAKGVVGPLGQHHHHHKSSTSTFDREAIYEEVREAVLKLSRQKMGALITFEKNVNLDDYIKTGSRINAPVSAELIETIFYPGTRLHDGAIVIRDNLIVAASVYFTPTNRPLIGKFGSRHRAAYGISEVTDAVTIVVSEETGRISIAYDSDLTGVNPDSFMRVFKEAIERKIVPGDVVGATKEKEE